MARSHSLVNPATRDPGKAIIDVALESNPGGDVHVFVGGIKDSITIAGGRSAALSATAIRAAIDAMSGFSAVVVNTTSVVVTRDNGDPFEVYITTNEAQQTYTVTTGLAQSQAMSSRVAALAAPLLDTDGVPISFYEWITVTGMIHNPTGGAAAAVFKVFVMDQSTKMWYQHAASATTSVNAATDRVEVAAPPPFRNKGYARVAVALDSLTGGCQFSCWSHGQAAKDF